VSLPGILKDVAEVAGVANALELARRHGGTEIKISDADGSALVAIVGKAAAAELVKRLARGKMMVPMANVRGQKGRRAAAAEMMAKHASARDAALACDIHERTAWRAKAKLRGETPLFDSLDEPED
jgi:hypothetical protein